MSKEDKENHQAELFTLVIDKTDESQEALLWLQEQGIPFFPQQVNYLPNGLPELSVPRLITPVGSFIGRGVFHFTSSFYRSVLDYIRNA